MIIMANTMNWEHKCFYEFEVFLLNVSVLEVWSLLRSYMDIGVGCAHRPLVQHSAPFKSHQRHSIFAHGLRAMTMIISGHLRIIQRLCRGKQTSNLVFDEFSSVVWSESGPCWGVVIYIKDSKIVGSSYSHVTCFIAISRNFTTRDSFKHFSYNNIFSIKRSLQG